MVTSTPEDEVAHTEYWIQNALHIRSCTHTHKNLFPSNLRWNCCEHNCRMYNVSLRKFIKQKQNRFHSVNRMVSKRVRHKRRGNELKAAFLLRRTSFSLTTCAQKIHSAQPLGHTSGERAKVSLTHILHDTFRIVRIRKTIDSGQMQRE